MIKKHSPYTSQRKYGTTKRQTHKQQLAAEYNFMFFRVGGAGVFPPHNCQIPYELEKALDKTNFAIKDLKLKLRNENLRQAYIEMNKKEEKK